MANKKTRRKPATIKSDEQTVVIEKTAETSDDLQMSQTPETVQIFDKKGYESERFWFFGGSFVIIVAAVLRFYWLSLKPFHHDEGVNGYFLIKLVRKGIYEYNPENYHGPTLYYFSLFSTYLFGLTDFGLRFVPAIFGVFVVVAALSLRRYLGTIGALTAAMLLALSPGMVYISRYFIHEIPFVFFTLAAVVCVVKFIQNRPAGTVAIGVMSLIIITCLFPGTLNFANYIGIEYANYVGVEDD
ncbi:MAG: TIGR03663 family protein, partial [Pyrinomonadaceae bacterium]|nr:TIGR03663 family protein [Pyrinomonadaceae bacterium]